MRPLELSVAFLVLLVAQLATANAQTANVSVLHTQVALVADYAADTRAARSSARVNPSPSSSLETESAFERMGDIADKRAGKKYGLSIVVRNDGAKAIRSLTFEYPLGYLLAPKPPRRIIFKAKQRIEPAATVTLRHDFSTDQRVVLRSGEPARINRIVYVDGSVWRR